MTNNVTPRSMAMARKGRAIAFLSAAVLLLLAALSVPFNMPFKQGVGLIFLLLAGARALQVVGNNYLIEAQRADSGADGEDYVNGILQRLPEMWEIQRNYPADYLGDIDFLVTSPAGKVFIVEVKSHKGVVCNDHDGLFRRVGYQMRKFEKNPLQQAENQACWVRDNLDKESVTPIICFTRAEAIQTTTRCLEGVYLAKPNELLMLLDRLTRVKPAYVGQ
ncbi:MAG TPA: nuclease-related domain-containing protein [Planktothrix sp.]|jgi:Holliday junction resolvase-like predicted endonuclease